MRPEKDLIEFLIENNHADAAESIQEYCMNTISMNLIEKNDELPIGSSKLGGFPNGGNIPNVDENNYLLFQYNYNVGMIYNLFWTITKEDLSNLNFENAGFDFDLD